MSLMQQDNQGGGSIAGPLGVAFVVLKLLGVIDWSWWWVTAPFWGPAALILGLGAVAGALYLVGWLVYKGLGAYVRRQRRR